MEQPGLKPSSSLSYLDGWWWNNPVTFWMRIKSWFSSHGNPLCMDDHPAMISKMMGIAHTRLFLHFQGLDFFLTAKKLDHAIKKLIA